MADAEADKQRRRKILGRGSSLQPNGSMAEDSEKVKEVSQGHSQNSSTSVESLEDLEKGNVIICNYI